MSPDEKVDLNTKVTLSLIQQAYNLDLPQKEIEEKLTSIIQTMTDLKGENDPEKLQKAAEEIEDEHGLGRQTSESELFNLDLKGKIKQVFKKIDDKIQWVKQNKKKIVYTTVGVGGGAVIIWLILLFL